MRFVIVMTCALACAWLGASVPTSHVAERRTLLAAKPIKLGAKATTFSVWMPTWTTWSQDAFNDYIHDITASVGTDSTIIYLGFMAPDQQNGMVFPPDMSAIQPSWIQTAKQNHPGLRFVISMGGWSYSTVDPTLPGSKNYFADLNPDANWANAVFQQVARYNVDGVDVDYEDQEFPYSSSSKIALVLKALCEANVATPLNVSVTVVGSCPKVIGGLQAALSYPSLRVVNMMLYDSGVPSAYDPRSYALEFANAVGVSKLGFGIELAVQAGGLYVQDPGVSATYAAYAATNNYADVFVWAYDRNNVAPPMFRLQANAIRNAMQFPGVPGACPLANLGTVCISGFKNPISINA